MMRRIFSTFATRSPLQARFLVVGLLAIVAVAPFDRLVAGLASHVSEGAKRYWYLVTDAGTERVNDFETPGTGIQAWPVSVFGGGLIHAATGLAGGRGAARTNRCGLAKKARSRTC